MEKEESGAAGVGMGASSCPMGKPDVRGGPQGLAQGSYGHHPIGQESTDLPRPSRSSRVPTATERKCSPDSPGMTFPRNIKKVWSARCGHQRLGIKEVKYELSVGPTLVDHPQSQPLPLSGTSVLGQLMYYFTNIQPTYRPAIHSPD